MTDHSTGLTAAEVHRQRQAHGYNEIDEKKLASALQNLFKIFSDPMGLMMLTLSAVYALVGQNKDAIILLVAYIPIIAIDVLLELRSQKALRALKSSLSHFCHVIRDGKTQRIPTRDLVPGDLLVVEEGQALAADGRLIQAANLTVDESSLTGESIPIEKKIGDESYSGSTVLTGTGLLEVEKTGGASQIGSIAKILREFESQPSPLLRTVRRLVKIFFLAAIVLAFGIFLFGYWKSGDPVDSLISALTLAMAAIPEEFPLVFTLYLSISAYRLSKKGILVKSLPAIEGLGRVDVICTDKTGTLTEGKFRLERISTVGASLTEADVQALVFSCEIQAVDAMEAAVFEWVRENQGPDLAPRLHSEWELQYDYPFDTKEKYMSHVWRNKRTGEQILAMKGAVEGVLNHCANSTDRAAVARITQTEATEGKRLLGLALKLGKFSGQRIEDEGGASFRAVLSFTDPVRPGVKSSVAACAARGIRLKMLTGDHLLTAHAIADKIDLPHRHDQLFTGPDLEKMPPEARAHAFREGAIFARLKPEQKLELVQALKAEGDIVAMTGDGINDAPALKLADVSISMGERATDVARSTAQLVLLKSDFRGIVASVLEGRRVLKSLGESFGYLIAFHLPIVSLAIYQALFLEHPILKPIHIVLMELIVHPVSAFVFTESKDVEAQVSRGWLGPERIAWSAFRGATLTAYAILLFHLQPGSYEERGSLAALALVAGNIGLLAGERGGWWRGLRGSARQAVATALLFGLTASLAYVPILSQVFSIQPPPSDLFWQVVAVGVALGSVAGF